MNADYYQGVIAKLCEHVARRQPEMKRNFLLHHDNDRPYTAGSFLAFVNKKKFEIFLHLAHSPDLAPCDFWLFPQLKAALQGQHFEITEECITTEQTFLNSLSSDDFEKTFTKWQDRMRFCLVVQGAYFEKDVQTLNLTDDSEYKFSLF